MLSHDERLLLGSIDRGAASFIFKLTNVVILLHWNYE